MISQELLLCLRETAFRLIFKPFFAVKKPEEYFLNPPCKCANPGQELTCEDCPYLEAYLTRCKNFKFQKRNLTVQEHALSPNLKSSSLSCN